MRWKTGSVTRGHRIVTVVGAALVVVVMLAYGVSGTATAVKVSCGTYCRNIVPPYPVALTSYVVSGGGSYSLFVSSDNQTGVMLDSQQSSASYAEQEILYGIPALEGDSQNFQTEVGIDYTFTTVLDAAYSMSGWCIPPYGEWVAIVGIEVEVGLVGQPYSTTSWFFEYTNGGSCILFGPQAPGNSALSEKRGTASGDPEGTMTQVLAIWIPAGGPYTPFVELYVYTYAEGIGLAGASASINMATGGYYAQWTSVNSNWGPGEG